MQEQIEEPVQQRVTHTAGGVVMNSEGKVLVVSQHGNSWSLPKGHVEEGEDLVDSAKREVYEESGITQLTYVKGFEPYQRHRIGLDGKDDTSELKTIHMFLFKTSQTALQPVDPENPEAKWVDVNDVTALLTHPKDKTFFESISKEFI